MKEKFVHTFVTRFVALVLVPALMFGCTFSMTPAAAATSAEEPAVSTTPELRKGSLFLKANVPDDFYDVVCVTLKDKATEKELTLKVEGGTVFEVYIKLPDGEYEVVSAFVEKSNQYTVTPDKTEISVNADSNPSILLNVQSKAEAEEEVSSSEPFITDSSPDEPDSESSGYSEDITPTEADPTVSADDTANNNAESSAIDFHETEDKKDDIEDTDPDSTKEIIWDICLSILAAVIFFAIIASIVYLVRNKMDE